ncbi:hypothetical protein [Rhizobium sp. P32RR-XVIII]|uniref:hypothetical protein n=1 Tax=Rhizobium sp. P32RR-XVIII TaxID=2726738 RepID=UPI0019807FC8|nr:hypothetical protein [Rhizobium sp. P32RR-XVIII]
MADSYVSDAVVPERSDAERLPLSLAARSIPTALLPRQSPSAMQLAGKGVFGPPRDRAEASMFFARSAIALATRAPALPAQGNMAADRIIITDPLSGLPARSRFTSSIARSSTTSQRPGAAQ